MPTTKGQHHRFHLLEVPTRLVGFIETKRGTKVHGGWGWGAFGLSFRLGLEKVLTGGDGCTIM
jgi:hypothetical protein